MREKSCAWKKPHKKTHGKCAEKAAWKQGRHIAARNREKIMFDMTEYRDLWEYLRGKRRAVVLYGGGNGADKVLDRCIELGIEVRGIFASDGFTQKSDGRRRQFRSMTVLSLAELEAAYPENDYVVLLCFGSPLPDVIETVARVAQRHELYVPDMPVTDDGRVLDAALCDRYSDRISAARALLADEASRTLYDRLISARLSGSLSELLAAACDESERWSTLRPESYRVAADLGAYNGDTARKLLGVSPALERLYTFEPDSRTRRRLERTVSELGSEYPDCRIETTAAAAWSTDGTLAFTAHGNRGSGGFRPPAPTDREEDVIAARSVDSVLGDGDIDYIKYDVEGCEREALLGSVDAIRRCRPDLRISLYHRPCDMWELPLLLHDICPDYRMRLFRPRCLPAWEIELCAVAR